MAASLAVMPLLSRVLHRVPGLHIRALCAGRRLLNPEEDDPMGRESKDLLRQFPEPKNLLHKVISQALRTSQVEDKIAYTHSSTRQGHRVVLRLKWPTPIEVEGNGPSKAGAERQAAAQACKVFQDLGLLESKNRKKSTTSSNQKWPPVGQEVTSRARQRGSKSNKEDRRVPVECPEDAESTAALKEFGQPKQLLTTVIQVATGSPSGAKEYIKYKHEGGHIKTCRLSLQWPQPLTFVAQSLHRLDAERRASALACQKLKELGLLDSNNKPLTHVMYNRSAIQELREKQRQAKKFQVPEDLLSRMEDYFQQYPLGSAMELEYEEQEFADEEMESLDWSDSESTITDPITGKPYVPLSEEQAHRANVSLEEKWCQSQTPLQQLPADHHREAILATIEKNPVVVIAGDTGCGKTTRIPRFILEDAILSGWGSQCNILITQPRRISAISVALRVGQELGPVLRRNAGYQVRLESMLPPRGGALLFCTVGVLLKKLQTNPTLEGVSHIIVDEVHERDVNTDFLLILLKQAREVNPHIRVVLMSATGDNERISKYFGNCPIVRVPGFMYPVKPHYLEDVLSMMGKSPRQSEESDGEGVLDLELISNVVVHVARYGTPGAILCFLPGWQEICEVQRLLQETLSTEDGRHIILPVHSNIPMSDQQAIFQRPPPDVRKIVLATNIAETSVTIDDIVHVVDSGMQKEQRYDLRTKVSCLETTWVSKSNVTQRRGRAGRCQPGFSYHLFTRQQHEALPEFQVPEILRTPLENLVVQAKIHTPEMTAVEFLSQALESPDKHAIRDAVRLLQEIRVLDKHEQLTLLGQRVANITTDPSLAKAIVLATIFRCLQPLLVTVACLTRDPFHGRLLNRAAINKVKAGFSAETCSDHLAFVRILQAWREVLRQREAVSREEFLADNFLSKAALRFIQGLVLQFASNVEEADLVASSNDCVKEDALCNQLSSQDELVKGVLLAGLYPNLIQVKRGHVISGKFRPNSLWYKAKGGAVLLHKSTVNRDEQHFRSPWLTYFQAVKSTGAVFVRDSSMVNPLAVLLMADSSISYKENGEQMIVSLSDSDLLKLESDSRTIGLLSDLRQALRHMVERNLQEQLPPLSTYEEDQYTELLSILVDLLNRTSHCFQEEVQMEE
ncbi:ATP-dependent RNA helicase DHX30 [Hyperolius riggenbachi]|uniref:ATP-dependent RNA helicase DHX30 n=1 Tax=Hyperolius riggenbachi TaxID=752182 RepID=UPI0035A35366